MQEPVSVPISKESRIYHIDKNTRIKFQDKTLTLNKPCPGKLQEKRWWGWKTIGEVEYTVSERNHDARNH